MSMSSPRRGALGVPEQTRACLFDLDGVLADTARIPDTPSADTAPQRQWRVPA